MQNASLRVCTPHPIARPELTLHPEGAPDLIGRESFAETDAPARDAAKRIEPG